MKENTVLQLTFTCSNSTIQELEKGAKYIQSKEVYIEGIPYTKIPIAKA